MKGLPCSTIVSCKYPESHLQQDKQQGTISKVFVYSFGNNFADSNINRNIAINMGLTKSEIFTEKQNKLASMMKALAHPARIAIIQYLVKAQACICGDLVEELGLAQATISQHLKELKNAGLIQGTIEGTSVCYCIDPKIWNQYKTAFDTFFVSYENKKGCC